MAGESPRGGRLGDLERASNHQPGSCGTDELAKAAVPEGATSPKRKGTEAKTKKIVDGHLEKLYCLRPRIGNASSPRSLKTESYTRDRQIAWVLAIADLLLGSPEG